MNLDDFMVSLEVVGRGLVEFFLKFEVPLFFVLTGLSDSELGQALDGEGTILFDDLLEVGGEFVVAVDLLFHQPILFEVFVEDLPQVVLLILLTHINIYII